MIDRRARGPVLAAVMAAGAVTAALAMDTPFETVAFDHTGTIVLEGAPGNIAVRHHVEGGGVARRNAHWQILINEYLARQGE